MSATGRFKGETEVNPLEPDACSCARSAPGSDEPYPATLAIHAASTFCREFDTETRRAVGFYDALMRLSIGLEEPGDIITDLQRALAAAQPPLAASGIHAQTNDHSQQTEG